MLKRFAASLSAALQPISSFLDKLSWIVLFFMMVYTVVDVLTLKLFNYSLLGTVEMTALMMVLCVFFSFAQTEFDNGHIRVDFVYNRFSERTKGVVDFLTQFLCAILFGFVGWASVLNGFEKLESNELTMDLLLPLYPFAFIASVGCCLICVVLFIKTLLALDKVVNP
jgi:TRAP-type transport system small permease protein